MSHLLLAYLLGVWLLLTQIPSETTANSLRALPAFMWNNPIVSGIGMMCTKNRDANIQDEWALQQKPLSDVLVPSRPGDVEALNMLLDFIPESPQEMKAILSDSQSFLRKIQHPKEIAHSALGFLASACCKFNCGEKVKKLICSP